jgi:pimeloyl-ACP methyl ester carboxylesterase
VTDSLTLPRESWTTVDGLRTRYRVSGSGRPAVLLHGIGRSLEDWDDQHALLSPGHRLYSVDLPGFGRTAPLAGPYSLAALARFVADFLAAVGEDGPVDVVGNSLGGAVAMQLSADAPGRVRSLTLVNSAGFGREVALALRLLAVRPLGRWLLRPSRSAVARSERSLFFDPSLVTANRVDLALDLAKQPHASRAFLEMCAELGTLRGIRPQWRSALLDAVAGAGLPTLVVWGDKDLVLPHAHLDAARQRLPHARFHLFPDTGHLPQIERAEELAGLMRQFWDGLRD